MKLGGAGGEARGAGTYCVRFDGAPTTGHGETMELSSDSEDEEIEVRYGDARGGARGGDACWEFIMRVVAMTFGG